MVNMYITVFLIIAICAGVAMLVPQYDSTLYSISLGILTLFLCFRFGQGTDYPGYMCIYHYAEIVFDPQLGFGYYLNNIHSEFGWKILMILFKLCNVEFWAVTFVIAGVTMLCTHLCIRKYCNQYRTLALVILYPTIYLTYYFSGIRQGLAMAIFYGILLNKLLDKKYLFYILGVLAITTLHKSSIVYLLIPFIMYINRSVWKAAIIFSFMFGIGMVLDPVRDIIKQIAVLVGVSGDYFGSTTVGWFSLAERILMQGLILILWNQNKENIQIKRKALPLMKIYFTGFLIYISLCSNSFISSRLAIMFKMAEIVLIPILIGSVTDKLRKSVCVAILCVSCIMMYKNLNYFSEIYYSGISGYNLPYITIFNQTEILNNRSEYVNKYYGFEEHNYLRDWL